MRNDEVVVLRFRVLGDWVAAPTQHLRLRAGGFGFFYFTGATAHGSSSAVRNFDASSRNIAEKLKSAALVFRRWSGCEIKFQAVIILKAEAIFQSLSTRRPKKYFFESSLLVSAVYIFSGVVAT